jgi:hypothetical protein
VTNDHSNPRPAPLAGNQPKERTAVNNVSDLDIRVVEIIECERQADDHEARADEFRWRAAELIAAELAAGKTQRQLAAEIGKARAHVRHMDRLWERFGHLGAQDRPPFAEAYRQAKLAEAEADETRRRSAVSYQGLVYTPAALIAKLAGDSKTPAQVAAHMRDYPQYVTADRETLITAGQYLIAVGEAS